MIQDITRPLGIPIQHSSIPFQNSIQSQTTMQNMKFLKDRMADILKMADEMQIMIDVTARQAKVTHDLATAALDSAKTTQETSEITDTLRDHIADFEDFYRPIRSYFYSGEALLRHPGLYFVPVVVRLDRRLRPTRREVS